MTDRRVVRPKKKPGWWTPERREILWAMYAEGIEYPVIAKVFGVTIAAVQRQLYAYKKEQTK